MRAINRLRGLFLVTFLLLAFGVTPAEAGFWSVFGAITHGIAKAASATYTNVIKPAAHWTNEHVIQPVNKNVVQPAEHWAANTAVGKGLAKAADWVGKTAKKIEQSAPVQAIEKEVKKDVNFVKKEAKQGWNWAKNTTLGKDIAKVGNFIFNENIPARGPKG